MLSKENISNNLFAAWKFYRQKFKKKLCVGINSLESSEVVFSWLFFSLNDIFITYLLFILKLFHSILTFKLEEPFGIST